MEKKEEESASRMSPRHSQKSAPQQQQAGTQPVKVKQNLTILDIQNGLKIMTILIIIKSNNHFFWKITAFICYL